jgi:hypothetical protein
MAKSRQVRFRCTSPTSQSHNLNNLAVFFPSSSLINSSDPEMSDFFLRDVLISQSEKEKEKLRESYKQKSPLAELLYTRWIEGLRERWPAI